MDIAWDRPDSSSPPSLRRRAVEQLLPPVKEALDRFRGLAQRAASHFDRNKGGVLGGFKPYTFPDGKEGGLLGSKEASGGGLWMLMERDGERVLIHWNNLTGVNTSVSTTAPTLEKAIVVFFQDSPSPGINSVAAK